MDDIGTVEPLYHVATTDAEAGEIVLKVVNARQEAVRTAVSMAGVRLRSTARVTTLTAESRSTVNSLGDPNAVAPVTQQLRGLGNRWVYDFPADSVTFIRMRRR